MRLSIITVVYNNERTITDAITSVLGQTFKDIEYIIIDGGSNDGTMARIEFFRDRIDQLVSEPDHGIYDAMNKGVQLATGDVIGILNSDDVYADDSVLERVMRLFESDMALSMVYGDLVYVEANDLSKVVRTWRSLSYYPNYFEDGHVPPHPSLFLKRKVYEQAGLFNDGMKLAADYELMLRTFKLFTFKSSYLPSILVKMRLGGSTNKSWKNILNGNLEILKAWKMNGLSSPILLMPARVIRRLAQFK